MSAQPPPAGPIRVAARLALAGAVLGVAVGLSELVVGASIRDWVGGKLDTTRLGLATTALGLLTLAAATTLRRTAPAPDSGTRVGTALALLLPALIGLTTAGRLWYLPGALLLGAGSLLLARTSRSQWAAAFTARHWRHGLLAACGVYYVFLGATALGIAGLLGIAGGLATWAAGYAASRKRRWAYLLLVAGAIPFALATWWTAVTPLLALLTIACGRAVIAHTTDPPATPAGRPRLSIGLRLTVGPRRPEEGRGSRTPSGRELGPLSGLRNATPPTITRNSP